MAGSPLPNRFKEDTSVGIFTLKKIGGQMGMDIDFDFKPVQ